MRHRWTPRVPIAVTAATVLLALSPGSAWAAQDGSDLIGDVRDAVGSATGGLELTPGSSEGAVEETTESAQAVTQPTAGLKKSSVAAPAPSSDDDSAGHETEDPAPPDHAAGSAGDVDLAEEDVADIGTTKSTVNDDDTSSADAAPLALGGEEILGAHAESGGSTEEHAGDPLAPLCEGTEGQVCLRVLYADAYASEDGGTSSSSSQSGVASVCVGGSSADPQAECDGAVGADAGTSEGEIERDKASGQTTASSESSVADACVQAPQAAECAVDASAVHSEGSADSGNSPGSAERASWVADAALAGEDLVHLSDPFALAVPPECPDPSVLCVFLNQGESYLGDGVAGHAQEALHVELLRDTPLVTLAELGQSETLVHNAAVDTPEPPGDGDDEEPGDDDGDGPGAGDDDGAAAGDDDAAAAGDGDALANTGGVWAGLLAIALFAVSIGSFLVAYSRRKMTGASA
ncbi:MAG: hypothetical protein ACRDO1_16125 [Nocardioidaceae bacterium]